MSAISGATSMWPVSSVRYTGLQEALRAARWAANTPSANEEWAQEAIKKIATNERAANGRRAGPPQARPTPSGGSDLHAVRKRGGNNLSRRVVQRPDAMGALSNINLACDLATGHINHGEFLGPARTHQNLLAVTAHVDTVGPARCRVAVHHCQGLQIDFADAVGHAVADQHMALVAKGAKSVGTGTGLDDLAAPGLLAAHVVDLDRITAGEADQNEFVVGRAIHIGRDGAGLGAPLDGLAG